MDMLLFRPISRQDREMTRHDFFWGGNDILREYTVKRNYEVPGFFLTKPSWDWDWVNYSWPGRVGVIDIPAGDGKSLNLYLQYTIYIHAV